MTIERFEIDTEQWAVVPRVPTEEMLRAGADALDTALYSPGEECYEAMLAAAPRPEHVQQDGAVTDYGSIGQQSEFIQLFNAAFEALKHGHSIGICWDLMKAAKAELNKLAKQQPAPRPVPTPIPTSDWISLAEKAPDCLEVRIKLLDGSEINCWAQSDGDFYWKNRSGEHFICESDVTHWRHAEPDGGAV